VDLRPPSGGIWVVGKILNSQYWYQDLVWDIFKIVPEGVCGIRFERSDDFRIGASTTFFDYLVHQAEIGYLTADIANHCRRRQPAL